MRRRDLLVTPAVLPWTWFRRDPRIAGIRFEEIRNGTARHYVWLHGNEQTAGEILRQHMKDANGRALLVRSTERNVSLLDGKADPNRIWSREGAEKNLRSLNPSWDSRQLTRALDAIDDDRSGFLRRLLPRSGRLLVALHNNGPGYSVKDEVPISDAAAMNSPEQPDEFLLCTFRADFEVLAGGPFNVVLQNTAPQEDDGSLSRLCAARNVRYVNIEAAQGNADGQRRMLQWVERVLF